MWSIRSETERMSIKLWVVCRGVLQRDQQGSPAMFAGIVTNLSHRGKVDYVTGLFMQQECERVVEECRPEGQSGEFCSWAWMISPASTI